MVVIGTASFILALVTFFSTRERVGSGTAEDGSKATARASARSILRNRYALLLLAAALISFVSSTLCGGSAAYYAESVLHDVNATAHLTNASTVAMVLGLIFIVPFVLKRFTKRTIYLAGIAASAAACFLSCLAPASLPLLVAMNAVKGLAMGGMGKFGIGLGTALMGAVLAAGGFSAGAAVQTGRGVGALIAVYTWIPGIVLALSLGIMFVYNLDKLYPEVARALRERRQNSIG